MAQVPTGSTFHVASTFGVSKQFSDITNAAEAEITSIAHGFSDGDIVEVSSGWGRINLRSFRVKSVTDDTFVLEGADTSKTSFYPVGNGGGSVRKVITFTQILTVMNPASSGGDPKKVNYKFVESEIEYSINDGFTAVDYSMDLDADSIGTPGYEALKVLTESQTSTILKIQTKSGSIVLVPCTVALNEAVSFQDGQINRVKASFSGNNRSTRYAA